MEDHAAILAELELHLDQQTLSLVLGAGARELAAIRAGQEPTPEEAERLRRAHELSRKTDLGDARTVLAALADAQALEGITRTRLLARGRYELALAPFLVRPTPG
jgi:hypothetical protein